MIEGGLCASRAKSAPRLVSSRRTEWMLTEDTSVGGLDEVFERHATDRATLQLLESKILSARLAEIDDKFAKERDYSEPLP